MPALQSQSIARRIFDGMCFIRADDHLHEFVANDIAVVEFDEFDAFEIRQNFFGFFESAFLSARQINLRDIAGDDRLRAETDAASETFSSARPSCSALRRE